MTTMNLIVSRQSTFHEALAPPDRCHAAPSWKTIMTGLDCAKPAFDVVGLADIDTVRPEHPEIIARATSSGDAACTQASVYG